MLERSVQITSSNEVGTVHYITITHNLTQNVAIHIIIRSDITWHVHIKK